MKLRNYSFLLLFFVLISCDNSKKEQEALQKEVIDKHNVLMLKMDEIMTNKSKLDSLSANFKVLKTNQPALDTVEIRLNIEELKTELTAADDAMMSWMHQFNPDYTGKSHDEIMSYLNNQNVKIDSVKTLFQQSLSKSATFISKF